MMLVISTKIKISNYRRSQKKMRKEKMEKKMKEREKVKRMKLINF